MRSLLRVGLAAFLLGILPPAARAARWVYEPPNDDLDGQLVNGVTWQAKTSDVTVGDLLLNVGTTGGARYDASMVFAAPNLGWSEQVSDAHLRVNMQGGPFASAFDILITAARSSSVDSVSGANRFRLARTQASVLWHITAPWDSSGQREAKWAESPDLSKIVNEVLAQPGWGGGAHEIAFFLEAPAASGERCIRFDDTHPQWPFGGNPGIRPARLIVNETFYDAFWGKELLCRPTPTSVEVNVVPHLPTLLQIAFGTSPGALTSSSAIYTADSVTPAQILLQPLTPDTRYYYRLAYRTPGSINWQYASVKSFVSFPLPGGEARLCVTSDIHVTNLTVLDYASMLAQLPVTLGTMASFVPQGYHAWIDLGDLVVIRAQRLPFDIVEVEQRYRQAREYVDLVGGTVPLLFVRGNHEEVDGWDYNGTPENTAIWSGKMLLKYLAPPLPNSFYSGNTTPFPDLGLPGDYWACRIGDLRIRAMDPYLYSPRRPHNGHGETGGSLDNWDWQIGDTQYQWLHDDLAANPSPYSMVAIHHLSSAYTGAGEYYGRGGIEIVKWSVAHRPTFEWGGEDSTGQNVIATRRPNWAYGAIHDLLHQFGNQLVLKGHDHFHARQALDGMLYVTLARPDDTGEQTGDLWGWRWVSHYVEPVTTFEPNSGFLSMIVRRDACTHSYIQTYPADGAGTVLDSFTLLPNVGATSAGASAAPARYTWIRDASPNPSRNGARITFELGQRSDVRLGIFDVSGRLVRDLLHSYLPEGAHAAAWDGKDGTGRRVAAGVYFAKLATPTRVDSVKMIVVR